MGINSHKIALPRKKAKISTPRKKLAIRYKVQGHYPVTNSNGMCLKLNYDFNC